jgi:hypothetical protein
MEDVLRLQAEAVLEDELYSCNALTFSSRGSICL